MRTFIEKLGKGREERDRLVAGALEKIDDPKVGIAYVIGESSEGDSGTRCSLYTEDPFREGGAKPYLVVGISGVSPSKVTQSVMDKLWAVRCPVIGPAAGPLKSDGRREPLDDGFLCSDTSERMESEREI
ncbi:hypothetical protein COU61_05050 [Candidatus Pacearchaeota archaeon CG10_big_fil_rev_8_21_14_0_10_35_13]|nr:MAG: hypothetical protein COU61_05050 [Candidatus Pacearchaeota archaeon CG10_big_fil_rev_8_21_14_0_10_35_13]